MTSGFKAVVSCAGFALISGTVFAGGIIRDASVSTPNHSALSIGAGIFSYSSTPSSSSYYGAPNPTVLSGSVPNSTAPSSSSSNAFFNPDVVANPTNSSGYGTNYLSAFNYYLSTGNTSRNALYSINNGFGTATEQSSSMPSSYNGNTFGISYLGLGTGAIGFQGSYRANISQTVTLLDGAANGQAGIVSGLTISRQITGGADDNFPIVFNIGLLADAEPGGSTGGTASDLSGAGERRIRLTSGSNFAEVVGYGATSFQVGNRSTSAGSNNLNNATNLAGAGDLGNSVTGGSSVTSPAVGLVWTGITLNAGQSITLYTGVSFNQSAVPAPASIALLGLGGVVTARRRRHDR
jgi:hypothetical protein